MKTITKSLSLVIAALFLTATVVAQETETRNISSFDGISVSAGIQAELVKGNTNKVEITAKGIDLDKVTTKVSKDILKVSIEQSWWKSLGSSKKRKVQVVITYSDALGYIGSSSGSSVWADHTILSNELDMDASSGASIDLTLDVNDASLDLSSGANVNLSGNSRSFKVDLSSGSNLNAMELVSEVVDVDGSSGSNAKVHATKSIIADVSSGANVKYAGNPGSTDIDKSSGGSVKKSSM